MSERRWSRTGRPRPVVMPVAAPAARQPLLVDRGELVVPVDAVRLGRSTVGSVLRSLRSIGLDDVAPDVDEAAWRLQQSLRPPTSVVTPVLDAALWRVPRARGSVPAAVGAALLRGLVVAAGWIVGLAPLLLLPGEARLLPIGDATTATLAVLVPGVAALLLAAIQVLAVLEAASRGARQPGSMLVIVLVAALWAAVPIWAVWQLAPTWLSLHAWITWPVAAAVLCAIVALALQDSLPGGARRRRAAPPQSMPRATSLERLEALVAVATTRLAALDEQQRQRLDAAVATAVRDLHARGDVDDRTRDLLLAGTADEGFDALPSVLLAIDPSAPVPLGTDVSWQAIGAVLAPGDAAAQLAAAIGRVDAAIPATWEGARSERARIAAHQQALQRELDLHADPIAFAGTPVLDADSSTGMRGTLAAAWRALPWLAGAGAIWSLLMAAVVARGATSLGEVSAWIAWLLLLLGLVAAIGWGLATDAVEAVQRHRSRAGLLLWQLAAAAAAVAWIASLAGDGGVGDGVSVLRVLLGGCVAIAVVATVARRAAWWRGAAPSRRVRGSAEWPLRLATASRIDAERRRLATERRTLDPEAFDRTRARIGALALLPIARGAMPPHALDDPAA